MSNDAALEEAIARALTQLEAEEQVVICTASPKGLVDRLGGAVRAVVPATDLTPEELNGLRLLTLQAIDNASFFDWEMPTLTGFTAEEFRKIADKLPHE